MAQSSNHLKILLAKPTTKIQGANLVERPRHVRRSVRKREVGVVQASQPHFITESSFSRTLFLCDAFHLTQDKEGIASTLRETSLELYCDSCSKSYRRHANSNYAVAT